MIFSKKIQVLNERAKMTFDSLFTEHNCQGGFNLFDNTIRFTNEFRSLPKRIQASFVSHELKHFEQADQVIRTFGIDRYIQALKIYTFKTLKNSAEYKNISDEIREQILDVTKKVAVALKVIGIETINIFLTTFFTLSNTSLIFSTSF